MTKLIALRTLSGKHGVVYAGQPFEREEADAQDLESRGLAYRYREPVVKQYAPETFLPAAFENKAVLPEETKTPEPDKAPVRKRQKWTPATA